MYNFKTTALFVIVCLVLMANNNAYSQGTQGAIAHITPNETVIIDIPINDLNSFILQSITSVNPISITEISILKSGNAGDGFKYHLVFRTEYSNSGCNLFAIQLAEENNVIYPTSLTTEKTTHSCTGNPCDRCYFKRDSPEAAIQGCGCVNVKGFCNHTITESSSSVVQLKIGIFDYSIFYNLCANDSH